MYNRLIDLRIPYNQMLTSGPSFYSDGKQLITFYNTYPSFQQVYSLFMYLMLYYSLTYDDICKLLQSKSIVYKMNDNFVHQLKNISKNNIIFSLIIPCSLPTKIISLVFSNLIPERFPLYKCKTLIFPHL